MGELEGGSTSPDVGRARARHLSAGDPRVVAVASAIVALIDAIMCGRASLPAGAAGGQSPPAEVYYTSRKGGPSIPGKSRAWMLRNVRSISGARKLGRDWIISAADFDRFLLERDLARLKRTTGGAAHPDGSGNASDEDLVEEAMRINKLRSHGEGK